MTEWLASLASASPESCQEAVADFSLLEAYTERLEDAEAGSAEVPFKKKFKGKFNKLRKRKTHPPPSPPSLLYVFYSLIPEDAEAG